MTWRFINATNVPVYLEKPGGCAALHANYGVMDSSGAPLALEGDPCGDTCEAVQERGLSSCTRDCTSQRAVMLPPGGAFEQPWDGSAWKQVDMPGGCVGPGDREGSAQSASCVQRVLPEAGTFELSLKAFTACSTNAGPCTCFGEAQPDGTCTVAPQAMNNLSLSGTELLGTASFTIPGASVVELRYEGSF
jgi:hypothetical protein